MPRGVPQVHPSGDVHARLGRVCEPRTVRDEQKKASTPVSVQGSRGWQGRASDKRWPSSGCQGRGGPVFCRLSAPRDECETTARSSSRRSTRTSSLGALKPKQRDGSANSRASSSRSCSCKTSVATLNAWQGRPGWTSGCQLLVISSGGTRFECFRERDEMGPRSQDAGTRASALFLCGRRPRRRKVQIMKVMDRLAAGCGAAAIVLITVGSDVLGTPPGPQIAHPTGQQVPGPHELGRRQRHRPRSVSDSSCSGSC